MSDDPVRVVFCSDETYAMPLAVAVRSLIDNATGPLDVTVLARGLTEATRERLLLSWGTEPPVRFVDLDEESLDGLSGWGYITSTMYGRILIPELMPASWPRAIYLDADIVVRSDLTPLWRHELAGKPVAATHDPLFARWWLSRRPDDDTPASAIFGTGVLVMDLDRWREEELGAAVLAAAHRLPAHLQSDQSAMNMVVRDRWEPLSHSWNVTTSMYFRGNRKTFAAEIDTMHIRHYSPFKPWSPKYRTSPDADLFDRYLARTAFTLDDA